LTSRQDGQLPRQPLGPQERPDGYPQELEADVRLSDGRLVHIRPIVPADAPGLAAAIAGADDETLRLRFLGWKPVLDDVTLQRLVVVDYRWRLALVALDANGVGAGIARYEGKAGEDVAEIAVAVAPQWRRLGLGSRLLRMLGEAAVARGIKQFVGYYLGDNDEVEGLVTASGLPHRGTVSRGLVETHLDLPPAPAPEPAGPHPWRPEPLSCQNPQLPA
jgi:GNAT superfamily N-acetyltransferase